MNITSRKQFKYALHAGHGSVPLYVKQHGINKVDDIILAACLSDLSFDPQCEDSRADWLIDLFFNTTHYDEFIGKIIIEFQETVDPNNHSNDTTQLYEILTALAKRKNSIAYIALKNWIKTQLEQNNLEDYYAIDWISLEGLDALIEVVESNGLKISNPNSIYDRMLTLEDILPEEINIEEARNLLKQRALESKAIQAFLDFDIIENKRKIEFRKNKKPFSREEWIRNEYSLEQLLAANKTLDWYQESKISTLGKFATLQERRIIQYHLENIDIANEQDLENLLIAFRSAEIPTLTPRLLHLARSKNTKLRANALSAIANSCDSAVGEFARSYIKNVDFLFETVELLDLFTLNFQAGDEQLILSSLNQFDPTLDSESKDKADHIGKILLALAENKPQPEIIPLLYWIYQNTPCSPCRYKSLKHLKDLHAITPEILQECLHDANPNIHALAQSLNEDLST